MMRRLSKNLDSLHEDQILLILSTLGGYKCSMSFPAFSNNPTTTYAGKTFSKFNDGQLAGVV